MLINTPLVESEAERARG